MKKKLYETLSTTEADILRENGFMMHTKFTEYRVPRENLYAFREVTIEGFPALHDENDDRFLLDGKFDLKLRLKIKRCSGAVPYRQFLVSEYISGLNVYLTPSVLALRKKKQFFSSLDEAIGHAKSREGLYLGYALMT